MTRNSFPIFLSIRVFVHIHSSKLRVISKVSCFVLSTSTSCPDFGKASR